MIITKNIFVILHVITAAAWFGLGLRLSGKARMVMTLDTPASKALADDTERSVYLMNVFIVLTLLFALVAFFVGGGFGTYGPIYHTSLLLIVLLLLDQFFVIRTGWHSLQATVDTEGHREQAEAARKRIAMGTGIGHLLWLIILVLMFWNQIQSGF